MKKASSGGFIGSANGGGFIAGQVCCRHGSSHAQRTARVIGRWRQRDSLAVPARGWIPERTVVGRRFRYGKGGRR